MGHGRYQRDLRYKSAVHSQSIYGAAILQA